MDDGLVFVGDTGTKGIKLNDTLNIKGGVTAANKLTDGNIGVVASADGLALKLAKELTGISSIANTAGGGKLTLSDTDHSVSVNGGRITNLGDATADTDAVNYKQLKALNSGKGIDVTKWQEAILPTISFFSGSTGTGANYKQGNTEEKFDLSKLAFDFGDGLKVEKQQSKDGKQIAHITLDKDVLKNDPNFKGAKGDDGAAGADGADGQSAYEIWKALPGNDAKTQDDFLAALKGAKGDKGDKGDAGNGNGGNGAEIKVAVTDDVVLDKDNLSKEEVVSNNGALSIKVGKNLNAKTVMNGNDKQLVISTTQEIKVDKVTVGNITLNQSGLTVKEGTDVNINMGGNQIHNIKAGTAPTDAVNVSQLNEVKNSVVNVANKLNDVEKGANEGISSAMAAAGLPQASLPVRSMVSAAGSTYKGAVGLAIGVSTVSDNGRWIIKGSVNSNSSGDVGATLGAGYQW
ncbi:YadA family autotransporter adhesin [Phocoenobacter skyensis]|uniref:YadA-like family protein n=1 Tax=Phocoenobacter skyensis TaxID=97481 RepID=A0ABT9JL33_9PAST|nr:YadA-like family protein [Pasteurella skyensis]MDP8079260.1 YadA-like family protein [Pasteurella skyensis]MDP8085521.1 YadA-like family protein [Pasteurella skyensis]